jgi:hypothetical protein
MSRGRTVLAALLVLGLVAAARAQPATITDPNIAFLKGIYAMDPGASLYAQQTTMVDAVEKAIKGTGF